MQLLHSRHGIWEHSGCLCLLHFLGVAFGQGPASPAPAGFAVSPASAPGPATASTTAPPYQDKGLPTCSCSCCQTMEALPYNFVAQATGGIVTKSCGKPLPPNGVPPPQVCPASCQTTSRMFSVIGAARKVIEMDYDRYCYYTCRPLADVAGSRCVPFEKTMYENAAIRGKGNGIVLHIKPVAGLGSGLGGLEKADASIDSTANNAGPAPAPGPANAAPGALGTGAGQLTGGQLAIDMNKPPTQIVFDERKLIAERLRAEAGASVSAAAAAAERTRFNRRQAKLAAKRTAQLLAKTKKISDAISEGGVGVLTAKQKAAEGEDLAREYLFKGKSASLYHQIMARTKKLADAAIEKVVIPRILKLEETKAEKKHLDKPDNWVNVVAARAAHPYQKAEVVAVQRVDEYLREANKVHWQAVALQNQANSLMPHANQMQSSGDNVGAAIQKKTASNLLARARQMQETAKDYWNKAKSTEGLIEKWAAGARQAAAHAAWLYSNEAVLSGAVKR